MELKYVQDSDWALDVYLDSCELRSNYPVPDEYARIVGCTHETAVKVLNDSLRAAALGWFDDDWQPTEITQE